VFVSSVFELHPVRAKASATTAVKYFFFVFFIIALPFKCPIAGLKVSHSSALADCTLQSARSSPGAPHRGGGLPLS
jgi:hypothetical protein